MKRSHIILTFKLRRAPGLVGDGLDLFDFPADWDPDASFPTRRKNEKNSNLFR